LRLEATMSYGFKLDPRPITTGLSVRDLVDHHLYAYNAARLREACQLFARKIAQPDVTIGLALSGAITPTGLGTPPLVPLIRAPEFQRPLSTAELHYLLGRYTQAREQAMQMEYVSVLTAAREAAVPLYTSSPGDSTIGMNVAALALAGNQLRFDVERDVNET